MPSEDSLALKLFLSDKSDKILASWLAKIGGTPENEKKVYFPASYEKIINTCYPEIVNCIIDGTDTEVVNWIKTISRQDHPVGFPLKYFSQGHSLLREIIIEEIWRSKKDYKWNAMQVTRYIIIVNRLIDRQLQKISEFYLDFYHSELETVQNQHHQLIDRMPEVIYSYSPEKGLTFISLASQRLLGVNPSEFYDNGFQLWLEYVHEDDRYLFLQSFRQQLETKQELKYEYRMIHKNGNIMNVVNRSIPIYDNNERLIGIDGIVINITERKKMEEQIHSRNNQLEQMAAELQKTNQQLLNTGQRKSEIVNVVAHDLRNPLNSIRIFTELLLKYKNSPEEYSEFLHRIDEETNRLMELIDNFLDIEKIEAGLMLYKEEEINLLDIVNHFISVFKWELDKKEIHFNMRDMDTIGPVWGDKVRMYQVFSNLLGNAIKFTPRNGKIQLAAKLVKGTRKADRTASGDCKEFLVISIWNSGPSIPKKYHKKIFAKFFQVKEMGVKEEKGSGLGLAIVKEIIEHHGGRIWVESEPRQGVTFLFSLPYGN